MTKQQDITMFREYAKRIVYESELRARLEKLEQKLQDTRQARDKQYSKFRSEIQHQKNKVRKLSDIIINERINVKSRSLENEIS